MELGDEAATDIVLAFSHLDVVEEVYDYLREVRDESWAKRMVGKLGAIYDSQGKHDLSVRTYRFILKKYPTRRVLLQDEPVGPHRQVVLPLTVVDRS